MASSTTASATPATTTAVNPSATLWLWRKWRERRRRNQLRFLSQGKFRLTREGVHFLAVLLFIFVGAVIREINLLILLAGCMIGLLILQWRFNTRTLLGLSVSRRVPTSATVGKPLMVALRINNPKRWLGAWLVQVEDRLGRTNPYPKKISESGVAIVDTIRPRGSSDTQYELTFHERGAYQIGPSTISTRFPMGLGRGWRTLNNEFRLIVRPKLGALTATTRGLFQQLRVGHAATSPKPGTHEAEFFGLRPWQSGDSRRWIHWRTTARLGEIAVRQFERQQHRQLNVLLDLHVPKVADLAKAADAKGIDAKHGGIEKALTTCELAISFVATLATQTARSATDSLSVAVAGKEQIALLDARSPVLVNNLLDALATIEPADNPNLVSAIRSLTVPLLSNSHLLVISTRSNQLSALLKEDRDGALAKFLSRVGVHWLDASSGQLEPYFTWTQN